MPRARQRGQVLKPHAACLADFPFVVEVQEPRHAVRVWGAQVDTEGMLARSAVDCSGALEHQRGRSKHTPVRLPVVLLRVGHKRVPQLLPQSGQHDLGEPRAWASNEGVPARLRAASLRFRGGAAMRLGNAGSVVILIDEFEARPRGEKGGLGGLVDAVAVDAARGGCGGANLTEPAVTRL